MNAADERTALLPFLSALRVPHIDNLRTLLTAIWIFDFASRSFGGLGGIISVAYARDYSSLPITTFNAINDVVVPSLFFVVSGRCSVMAFDTKSPRDFVKYKLLRLALPAAFHFVFLQVIFGYWISQRGPGNVKNIKNSEFWDALAGPSTYLVLLLGLDLVHLALRSIGVIGAIPRIRSPIVFYGLAVLLLGALTLSYLGALLLPIYTISLYTRLLGMYILAYTTGIALPSIYHFICPPRPLITFVAAYIASAISFVAAVRIFGSVIFVVNGTNRDASIFYAIWRVFTFIFVGGSLLACFEDGVPSGTHKRWGRVGRFSYGAILLHTLPVIVLQMLFAGGGTLGAMLVGMAGVAVSWAMSWVLVQVPSIAKII